MTGPRTSRATSPKPAVRPARRRLSVEERRAQLVELGIDAFSGTAYDDVSVDELASRAGISKGLLYHYFPTKRDYFVATIHEVARRLLEATLPPAELEPLERLRVGLDAYFRFVDRHGAAYAALLRSGIASDTEAISVIDRTRGVFVERLVDSLGFSSVTPLARIAMAGFVGFVEATSLQWAGRRDVAPEELIALWSRTLVSLVSPLLAEQGAHL